MKRGARARTAAQPADEPAPRQPGPDAGKEPAASAAAEPEGRQPGRRARRGAAARSERRQVALARWWRLSRRASEPQPEPGVDELEDVARRVEEALSAARARIESDISAASAARQASARPASARAGRRPGRGDKWQRDDNVFNEVSRAVNARVRGTLHDIRFSMSTRISWNYTRILWETLVISLVLLAVVYAAAALPRLEAISADVAQQVVDAARAQPGGLAALPEPTAAPEQEQPVDEHAAGLSGEATSPQDGDPASDMTDAALPEATAASDVEQSATDGAAGLSVESASDMTDAALPEATALPGIEQSATDSAAGLDGEATPTQDGASATPAPTRAPVALIELRLSGVDRTYARVSGIDGRVYYDDAPFELDTASVVSYWDGEFYRVDSLLVNADGYVYQVYVAVALTYWLRLGMIMLGGVALVDLMRGLYFLTKGRAVNAQMLGPIGEISETARALNAQNLSQRISVEGTRSELRELALVINDMLDRIEAAYDGQKQFVSDASHELRTPIAVIQGYATMLERWGKDDAAVRDEAISAISSEAANMKELVEKLLFLARHDRQTLSFKPELIDIRELTEATARETRMIAPDHDIVCGELQQVRVLGDVTALKQALRIFMDNACKYTEAGGRVTISCIQGGMGALISVEDTGCGIPAGELKRIFERFYRVDGSRGAVPGHGLGLSIARIIAVRHGGRIHVRSKEGVGSVFTLELPGIS